MRILLTVLLVVGWLAAFAPPVLSQATAPQDCNVDFNVTARKTKQIVLNKVVNKTFNLDVSSELVIPGWVEVEAFKCDHNTGNVVTVTGITSADFISSSFIGFTGLAQVNQSAGLVNNQGNVVAAGFIRTGGASMVEAAVEKINLGNVLSITNSRFVDSIDTSFNSFSGLAQVNQSAGIFNNQNNVVALGVNLEGVGLVAENETFLTMQNTGNHVTVTNSAAIGNIVNSFNAYTGVAQVNQSPGSLNNQANIVSIAGR